MAHHEIDDRSVRAAAEAMIKLLVVIHVKGRGFFIVKRAARLEFASRARQAHALAHNIRDIDTRA